MANLSLGETANLNYRAKGYVRQREKKGRENSHKTKKKQSLW